MYDFRFERFNTIYDFEKAVNSRETNRCFERKDGSHRTGDDSFFKTKSYEEANNLLLSGWSSQVENMREELKKFSRSIIVPNIRQVKSVAGYAPCIPNAINGVPKSMFSRGPDQRESRTVHLIFNNTANADTSGSSLMQSGMTILKLAMALDRMRVRTRIDMVPKMSVENDSLYGCIVGIKDYKQPFNLSKMAYPLAHVSFFRRHGFRWLETLPNLKNKNFAIGYGRSLVNFHNEQMKEAYFKFAGLSKGNSVYIDYNDCRKAGFDYAVLAESKGLKLA